MSDKHAGSFEAAVTANGAAFNSISKIWSECDAGSAANGQVADMTNPQAAAGTVKSQFDGSNPFQLVHHNKEI